MNKEKASGILGSPDEQESLFTDPELSGFSGRKIIALLQNLASCLDPETEAYLEIGVYQGMSLISVSKVFGGKTFGIDNFSQFDIDKRNYRIIKRHSERLGAVNSNLINADFEAALSNLKVHTGGIPIGILFIDGPHDYRSQLMCLLLAREHLGENAVIVVDDSNYRHVRQANADFLAACPEFSLAFERYTKSHPSNMKPEDKSIAMEGWWNGINVLVKNIPSGEPDKKISTADNKTLWHNDHLVHSSKYADCAPEAVMVTHALRPFRPLRLFSRIYRLFRRVRSSDPDFHGRYRHLNTYSDDLG